MCIFSVTIYTLYIHYIYSIYTIYTFFTINAEIQAINTRPSIDLQLPSVKLTKYKKGVYYTGTIIFNHLP
jgi:hypothetical protein